MLVRTVHAHPGDEARHEYLAFEADTVCGTVAAWEAGGGRDVGARLRRETVRAGRCVRGRVVSLTPTRLLFASAAGDYYLVSRAAGVLLSVYGGETEGAADDIGSLPGHAPLPIPPGRTHPVDPATEAEEEARSYEHFLAKLRDI